METSKNFSDLQKLFFIEKKYDAVISKIVSINDNLERIPRCYLDLLAASFFSKSDFVSAARIYQQLDEFYKVGYCHLLFGDIKTANLVWQKTPDSPAQNWGLFFTELFIGETKTVPSFLQIRAFLERDLAAFLKLNHVLFVQKIIDISEFLFDINPETNKIIARTFLYNNYPSYAKEYFNRAFDFTNEDAELFYLYGLYYKMIGNIPEARNAFRRACSLNSNYLIAKIKYEELMEK